MKKKNFNVIVLSIFLAFAFGAFAKENIGGGSHPTNPPGNNSAKSVNAQCVNATAQIDLDINNVRAK